MKCPACGKVLESERGMRQHHTKVHEEPLPNRTCKGCDLEFYDPKARRSFCDDCNPNAGENNGNWRDAKRTGTCKTCEATFSYYPSDKDGLYCSDCVADADGLLPENYSTKGERITVHCKNCGGELERRPAETESQEYGFFCSLDCYGKWLSENVVGPDHHQWSGGPITYGQSWWKVRRLALERDDYKCQHCGDCAEQLGQNPDVHHSIPVREFEHVADAHTLENVITLCRSCHRLAEAGTISISRQGEK